MKRILLLVGGIILAGSAFAQSISIHRFHDVSHSINDSTINIYGSLPTAIFDRPFDVYNVSGTSISVKAKWYILSGVGPVAHVPANAICWGSCYPQNGDTSWTAPSTRGIAPSGKDTTFVAYYYDSANAGTETVRYTFYNTANSNDSAWMIINWMVSPMSVAQINSNALHVSAPYPNPANTNVTFNYNMRGTQDATLEIYNSIGRCVQTLPVSSTNGKLSLCVSDLPAGVYICKMAAPGCSPVYQRLIVAH